MRLEVELRLKVKELVFKLYYEILIIYSKNYGRLKYMEKWLLFFK